MSKFFRKIITITSIVVLFVTGYILFISYFNSLQIFLSKTQKVKANLLIAEGWLPPYAIDMVYKEFRNNAYDLIVTTGIKYSAFDYCMVASNGYLIFYPHLNSKLNNNIGHHTIEVVAHSEMNGIYSAHFNFFVNDSLVADFNTDKRNRKYGIYWNGSLEKIDSLMIQFDNDLWEESGDRNLFVKEIIIDHKIIIPYQFNSELDIGLLDGKERISKYNYVNSSAEFCRNQLIACGIDSSLVIAVPAKKVFINRTLTSVMAFRDWFKLTDKRVTGMNIISLGIHSRRTWLCYKKLLGETIDIGIISLPENENHKIKRPGVFEILYEFVGIIYYRIILFFINL